VSSNRGKEVNRGGHDLCVDSRRAPVHKMIFEKGGEPVEPMEINSFVIVGVVGMAVVFLVMAIVILKQYRRVPPNSAMIITGGMLPGGRPKVVLFGGTFVWPVVQQVEILSLEVTKVDFQTSASSRDGKRLSVQGSALVKVIPTDEGVLAAASHFHAGGRAKVEEAARLVLSGQLVAVVSRMTQQELRGSVEKVLADLKDACSAELANLGLAIAGATVEGL
jgi:uncharacterized membrane protein YqiK